MTNLRDYAERGLLGRESGCSSVFRHPERPDGRATMFNMGKDTRLGLRVATTDRRAWAQAAVADGRTLSDWVTRRCNGEPATAPTRPQSRNPDEEE